MSVQATLVLRFGAGVDANRFAVAELDETLNLDGAGQAMTSFHPGDPVWFWVQHDAALRIGAIEPTGRSGEVIDYGEVSRSRVQECSWPDVGTVAELSHLPAAMPTLTWYGEPGQGLRLDGRSLGISGGAPCTCDATIPLRVRLYRYQPPALELATEEDRYRVILYITMEDA